MMIAVGSAMRAYKGYVLRMRKDKNTRIIEIFGPACSDIALSNAASVAEAKRWIDDYIDLEQTIADLIDRKKELPEDSAEYQLIERELTGLRYSREEAGGIMEDLEPFGWGGYCRPLPATTSPEPRQVLLFRRSQNCKEQSKTRCDVKKSAKKRSDPL
jgi:hypothetical protein